MKEGMVKSRPKANEQKKLAVFQTLITLGFLVWVFSQEQVRQNTFTVLASARPEWIFAGLIVAGMENFLGALRWRIFLQMLGVRIGLWQTIRLHFLGLFFNAFMIGSVGGDAVKIGILSAQGYRKGAALLSVVMDRTSGLAALLLTVTFFVLPQLTWLRGSSAVSGMVAFVVLYLCGLLLMLCVSFVITLAGVSRRIPHGVPFRAGLIHLCDSYAMFFSQWQRSLIAAGVSIVMLLIYFTVYSFAMRAFGVVMPLERVFALMPLVDIISALPVSLGGLGVREKLLQLTLGELAGVPAATAIWVSITGYLTALFWGLAGLMTLPFYRGLFERAKNEDAP
jgi:uncharacterized protein (TIRG00374 family)